MKKIFLGVLFFSFVIVSCNKQSELIPPIKKTPLLTAGAAKSASTNPLLQNGRLVFSSEAAFELKLNELDDVDIQAWEASLGFTSLRNIFLTGLSAEEIDTLDELPIDDAPLMSVLNAYGIVQVNPWIFKLNADTRQVYVLPVSKSHKAELLVQPNPQDIDIQVFSFDDEVFDLLEGGAKAACECASSRHEVNGWTPYCERTVGETLYKHKFKAISIYEGWGIIKALSVKFFHRRQTSDGYNYVWHSLYYVAQWERRCKALGADTEYFPNYDPVTQLYQLILLDKTTIKKSYRGTRCLSKYRVIGLGGIFENMCDAQVQLTQYQFGVNDLVENW